MGIYSHFRPSVEKPFRIKRIGPKLFRLVRLQITLDHNKLYPLQKLDYDYSRGKMFRP